jgi:hypothetical protein
MLLRLLLVAFNVGAVTILVYQLVKVYQLSLDLSKKRITIGIGLLLLLLPVAIIIGIVPPSTIYLAAYPVAIVLFLYLIKRL